MSLMNHKSAGSQQNAGHQRAKTGNTPRFNLMKHTEIHQRLKAKGNECFGRKEFCAAIQYHHRGIQMTSRNNDKGRIYITQHNQPLRLYITPTHNRNKFDQYTTRRRIHCLLFGFQFFFVLLECLLLQIISMNVPHHSYFPHRTPCMMHVFIMAFFSARFCVASVSNGFIFAKKEDIFFCFLFKYLILL
eukprot:320043_1